MYLVRSDDNTPLRDNNINWTVSLIILSVGCICVSVIFMNRATWRKNEIYLINLFLRGILSLCIESRIKYLNKEPSNTSTRYT